MTLFTTLDGKKFFIHGTRAIHETIRIYGMPSWYDEGIYQAEPNQPRDAAYNFNAQLQHLFHQDAAVQTVVSILFAQSDSGWNLPGIYTRWTQTKPNEWNGPATYIDLSYEGRFFGAKGRMPEGPFKGRLETQDPTKFLELPESLEEIKQILLAEEQLRLTTKTLEEWFGQLPDLSGIPRWNDAIQKGEEFL